MQGAEVGECWWQVAGVSSRARNLRSDPSNLLLILRVVVDPFSMATSNQAAGATRRALCPATRFALFDYRDGYRPWRRPRRDTLLFMSIKPDKRCTVFLLSLAFRFRAVFGLGSSQQGGRRKAPP